MNEPQPEALSTFGGFVAPHPVKFVFMAVASLGLYQMYWLYENWLAMDRAHYKRVIPWLRTLFYPVFTLSSFAWIQRNAAKAGMPGAISPAFLSILFFGLTFVSVDAWDLTSILNCLPLIYANSLIIKLRRKEYPRYRPESTLRGTDYSVIALGVALYFSLYFAKKFIASNVGSELYLLESLPPEQQKLLSLFMRFQ